MAEIKQFPNETPLYGKCSCGSEIFKLRLLGDGVTVCGLVCAKCGAEEPLDWAEDYDFEIECELEDD